VTVKDVYQCTVRGGRLGAEVTSQTQAIQSIADKIHISTRFFALFSRHLK